jgi:hypothetical protein
MRIRATQRGGGVVPRGSIINAGREAIRHAVEVWHRRFRPLHFTEQASRRYGYTPRQGSGQPPIIYRNGRPVRNNAYIWRKKRLKGHTKPLVWSGDSEASARSARFGGRLEGGTRFVGSARMDMPTYFFQHPYNAKSGKFIDKPKELTTVRDDEMAVLQEAFRREFLRELGQYQRQLPGQLTRVA